MKIDSTMKLFALFLGLATLSGFMVLTDNNSKVKTSEDTGKQFDNIASDEKLLKKLSETSGEDIVKRVEIQDTLFKSQKHWNENEFETVTINIEEFENTAANGNVSLRLLERDFEVQIKEISRLNGGKSYRYSGCVKGVPQNKATFYVCGELFSGSIEFEDLMYNIAVTSEVNDGKIVHVVFIMDWEKDRGRLKHLTNPLICLTFGQEKKDGMLLSLAPLRYCTSIYNPSGMSYISLD
jgi:hypothetical protein